MNSRNLIYSLFLLLTFTGLLISADRKGGARGPNALVAKEDLIKLTGPLKGAELSREVNILWLTGPEDHGGGEHDYIRIKELFVPMLQAIPKVTVDVAFQFPTQAQFDKADLMIQYLHLPDLTAEQFEMYQKFVDGGGSVVSIHESCIIRPVERAEKLAGCIGCSWKGNRESKWSKFNHSYPLVLDTKHPVFEGLPKSMLFNDESYWDLLKRDNVRVIGVVAPEEKAGNTFNDLLGDKAVRSDAFWTYRSGKGKVFGTTTGHYTYTYYDPKYRLLLMRGIAWALDEDPAPFMPIVYQGIENDKGMVGTTDNMMNYKNRKR